MSKRLVVAVGDYDHTRDLVSGVTAVPGTDVIAVARPEDLFRRVLGGEFAAAELSLAVMTVLAARGDDRFVALPVFPARSFRHGAFYVRSEGPSSPRELAGARIGVPVWVQTAGVLARGILASRYGVDLTAIDWVCAGVDTPGRPEPAPYDAGAHRITVLADRTLDDLLLTGEVDAVISARPPACVERGDPRVRRLFDDPELHERAYARDTGVFPIMHLLVVRRTVLQERPELAGELIDAFTAAKDASLRRALAATVPSYPLPWAPFHARAARELLGDDFWPYGLEPNRPTLESFLGYAAAQGLTDRRLTPEELLAPINHPSPI